MAQLVRASVHKSGDLVSNPGLGENFSLRLTIQDLSDGYSES